MKKNIFILLAFIFLLNSYLVHALDENKKVAAELAAKGVSLVNKGKFLEALELFNKAISLDPSAISYQYEKAFAYYNLNNLNNAITILDSLSKLDSSSENVFQLLSVCYQEQEKNELAVSILDSGLLRYPNSGRLYNEKGNLASFNKKHREAFSSWETGVRVDPSYPNNYYSLAFYYNQLDYNVWSLIYSEVYINISNNDGRVKTMSKFLLKTYKQCYYSDDTTNKIKMTSSIYQGEKNAQRIDMPFDIAYQNLTREIAKNQIPADSSDFGIDNLIKIRKDFAIAWFGEKLNEKFPLIVMEWHKKLIEKGFFDAYNYLIFKEANPKEFNTWYVQNSQHFDTFLKWFIENHFKLDMDNTINRNRF